MKKVVIFYKKGFRITERGNVINPKGEELDPVINNRGYIPLSCRYNGDTIKSSAHRLQAFQKYGELLFYKGVETRHKNGIKTDNSFDNILIGTHSQNMMDIPESVRMDRAIHASSFIRKYNKKEVIDFHKKNGNSYKKTMKEFDIGSKGTLHYVLKKGKVL